MSNIDTVEELGKQRRAEVFNALGLSKLRRFFGVDGPRLTIDQIADNITQRHPELARELAVKTANDIVEHELYQGYCVHSIPRPRRYSLDVVPTLPPAEQTYLMT